VAFGTTLGPGSTRLQRQSFNVKRVAHQAHQASSTTRSYILTSCSVFNIMGGKAMDDGWRHTPRFGAVLELHDGRMVPLAF